jgi:hypothetical protein
LLAVACSTSHTEEEVVRVWTRTADVEDLEKVKELAVDVADDSYGSLDVHNIALLHEHLFCLCAYGLYDRLGEQFLVVESLDALVEIDAGLQTSALATRFIFVTVGAIQGSPGMFAAILLSRAGAMGVGEEA